jgi:hypothetical protein
VIDRSIVERIRRVTYLMLETDQPLATAARQTADPDDDDHIPYQIYWLEKLCSCKRDIPKYPFPPTTSSLWMADISAVQRDRSRWRKEADCSEFDQLLNWVDLMVL